jgi:hypothetical protein
MEGPPKIVSNAGDDLLGMEATEKILEAEKVVGKLKELYPILVEQEIGVTVLPKENQWMVFFSRAGHEEAFPLPKDFVSACIEQGYCHIYREECTRALGRLMEAIESYKTSAAAVVAKMRELVPELKSPEITIAVSEDEPAWAFFMTIKGATRPVEYRLPMEVIARCLEGGDCQELKKATLVAYRCLMGV